MKDLNITNPKNGEKTNMANISFYGSHNASITVEQDGEILVVLEVERFANVKNLGYAQYFCAISRDYLLDHILSYIEKEYGIKEFETCIYQNTSVIDDLSLKDSKLMQRLKNLNAVEEDKGVIHYQFLIPAKHYYEGQHHLSHAAGAFYQTDYDQALIVSFDGGGNDGIFNIYHAKDRKTIDLLEKKDYLDLGFPYMSFGDFFSDIKLEQSLAIGNLVYSGKIMGLCSYGNVNEEWLPYFEEYYLDKPSGLNHIELLDKLSNQTGLIFDRNQRLEGQTAWDAAKTSQVAFENILIREIQPFLDEYPDIPLILTGGCGLNILLNTKLKESLDRDIFVPPNPNDCGLSSGMMLNHIKPEKAIDLTYSGVQVLDPYTLSSYVENKGAVKASKAKVVDLLAQGKIIGVVRNGSEHGPRALGNRSILCDPTFPQMKDVLNHKVKNREWYRPFAPVCRLEDVSKYFEFEGESRWMSFCPKVKEEWREKLVSITHVDGTARVQTVTEEQNPWLYSVLTILHESTGVGVLLNTSFNVNGKPILSTYRDAIKVFENTEMDNLLLDEYLF